MKKNLKINSKKLLLSAFVLLFIYFIAYFFTTFNSFQFYKLTITEYNNQTELDIGYFYKSKVKNVINIYPVFLSGVDSNLTTDIDKIGLYVKDKKQNKLIIEKSFSLLFTENGLYQVDDYGRDEIYNLIYENRDKNVYLKLTYKSGKEEFVKVNFEKTVANNKLINFKKSASY